MSRRSFPFPSDAAADVRPWRRSAAVRLMLWCGLAALCGGSLQAAEGPRKPNIVLIFADDLGWKDVGYQGTDFMETPRIDRLAKEGMVFTNAYAAAGNCAPSRACMISGTYTPRHHVFAVGSTDRGPKQLQRLIPIPNKSGLAKSNVTFADALKANGYATGMFGKWHLAGRDGAAPLEQGFDAFRDTYRGGGGAEEAESKEEAEDEDAPAEAGGKGKKGAKKAAGKAAPSGNPKGMETVAADAVAFVEANKDRPFFLYLPHHSVHAPLESHAETLARFQAKKPGEQHRDAKLAACLYDFDATIGKVLQKLADLGLEKDTLVVFTSDNGSPQFGSQEPLRGNKGAYYEGGVRVPMVVRWPGVVTPGSTSETPVVNLDFFPTFLAAAGASVPEGKVLDGESLLPLLKGEGKLARESIFWHFPGYLDAPVARGRDPVFRTRPVSVIRKGDWKLLLYHEEWQLDGGRGALAENRAVELYNLRDDLGERNDLSRTQTAKRDELLDDLLAWQQRTDAPLPTRKNPDYDPQRVEPKKKKAKAE